MHRRVDDSVRETDALGSLERDRCVQRVVGRIRRHYGGLLRGGAVGGGDLRVRGGAGVNRVQHACGEGEARRPSGGGAIARRVRGVGGDFHGPVRDGEVRE